MSGLNVFVLGRVIDAQRILLRLFAQSGVQDIASNHSQIYRNILDVQGLNQRGVSASATLSFTTAHSATPTFTFR
jgi:hypothetical protein